jgi:prevent-host-death family protein
MEMMNATEARRKFLGLIETLEKDPKAVHKIEKRGHPAAVLLSMDLYESMLETMDILGDEETMKKLRQSTKDVTDGKTIPWDIARKRLGLK